jgi:hypothetical protein
MRFTSRAVHGGSELSVTAAEDLARRYVALAAEAPRSAGMVQSQRSTGSSSRNLRARGALWT